MSEVFSPRPDHAETPLLICDLILFVDGSAFRNLSSGKNLVGFAVASANETLISGLLPGHYSVKAVKLVALTEACKLSEGKTATIYTDSCYGFGFSHDFGHLWK